MTHNRRLFAFISFLLLLGVAQVAATTESLDFNSLPSAQGWSYSTGTSPVVPESAVFSVDGTKLVQNTQGNSGSNNGFLSKREGVLDPARPFSVTMRARVVNTELLFPPSDTFAPAAFLFGASTGTEEYFIGIMAGKFLASTGVTIPTAIDNSQFHDYRLEITPGVGGSFYVDGSFVSSINPNTVSNTAGFFLGDGTNTANAHGEITSYVFTQSDLDFTDIAADPGINLDDSGDSRGATWGDYDNDGDPDLYLVKNGPNRMFQNTNGTFADVTSTAQVGTGNTGQTAIFGDYDNDGFLDLYVTNFDAANVLFNNDGDATFTNTTASAQVNVGTSGGGAGWADYDNDGDLDLYATRFNTFNAFYRNDGPGVPFTSFAGDVGIHDTGTGWGVGWADYDNDGDSDLYVVNGGTGTDRLYRNDGPGNSFASVAGDVGITDGGSGNGLTWTDYNGDGDLDLYVANNTTANKLFLNDGDGTFTDITTGSVAADSGPGIIPAAADYDLDGDSDIFATNFNADNRLFENDGNASFIDITTTAEVGGSSRSSQGTTVADYDLDGDPDIYVVNRSQANRLFRNNSSGINYLQVDLTGAVSNRSGIGARVTATTGGTSQIRAVDGSGYLGQPTLRLNFGLGSASTVNQLTVEWPSGQIQSFNNVAANQVFPVTELTPDIDVATTLSLGASDPGVPTQQTLSINNIGPVNLNISDITFSGNHPSDFSVSTTALTVASGQTGQVTVTFTPGAEGGRDAILSIHSDDPDEDPANVALDGTGDLIPTLTTGDIIYPLVTAIGAGNRRFKAINYLTGGEIDVFGDATYNPDAGSFQVDFDGDIIYPVTTAIGAGNQIFKRIDRSTGVENTLFGGADYNPDAINFQVDANGDIIYPVTTAIGAGNQIFKRIDRSTGVETTIFGGADYNPDAINFDIDTNGDIIYPVTTAIGAGNQIFKKIDRSTGV